MSLCKYTNVVIMGDTATDTPDFSGSAGVQVLGFGYKGSDSREGGGGGGAG